MSNSQWLFQPSHLLIQRLVSFLDLCLTRLRLRYVEGDGIGCDNSHELLPYFATQLTQGMLCCLASGLLLRCFPAALSRALASASVFAIPPMGILQTSRSLIELHRHDCLVRQFFPLPRLVSAANCRPTSEIVRRPISVVERPGQSRS